MKEVGRLKELGVKPGDVVELVYNGICDGHDVGKVGEVYYDGSELLTRGDGMNRSDNFGHTFRIISRASEKPKLWRDMTPEEKGALLLAAHEGKVIEVYGGNGWWSPCLLWVHSQAYRIRPEPKVETVTITLCDGSHDITFNTIDGKPDCASIKMEAL